MYLILPVMTKAVKELLPTCRPALAILRARPQIMPSLGAPARCVGFSGIKYSCSSELSTVVLGPMGGLKIEGPLYWF